MKEGEIFKQLLTLVLGGVIGVVFKYWYDYKAMVYKELWTKRCETYKRMFSLTGILPQYPRNAKVTYGELFKRSEEMRDWYFEEGGLLLSNKSRNKYFKVQKRIREVYGEGTSMKEDEQLTGDYDYEYIRKIMSQFRRTMTDDLMSRSRI